MKAYTVQDKDMDDYRVCIIADTPNEAKALALNCEGMEDCEYIDLRATICTGVDITGLEKGELDCYIALQRGIYGYVIDGDCPKCKAIDVCVYYDNGFYCNNCEETPKTQNKTETKE